jgi:hypothetical protein
MAGLESRIDSYLARVRAALRGLPEGEIEDILRELRSHANELAEGQGVEAALRSLGDPVDLAKTYRAENEIARAECSGSPLRILQGLRHSSHSRIGRVTVSALYFFGYANVLKLWVTAADKLFFPSRTGLWYISGDIWSLRLVTDGRPLAGAHELLGWWLVPIVIVAGWIVRYLVDSAARWWIRHYRQSKLSQT